MSEKNERPPQSDRALPKTLVLKICNTDEYALFNGERGRPIAFADLRAPQGLMCALVDRYNEHEALKARVADLERQVAS